MESKWKRGFVFQVHTNIKYADEKQWNHVSSCILNSGSIRSPIDERNGNGAVQYVYSSLLYTQLHLWQITPCVCRLNPGSITMEDLMSVLPFGGTFDLVQLNGSALKKVFEHSVSRYGESTGRFLQVSGNSPLSLYCCLYLTMMSTIYTLWYFVAVNKHFLYNKVLGFHKYRGLK